jgi:hypothetical protein
MTHTSGRVVNGGSHDEASKNYGIGDFRFAHCCCHHRRSYAAALTFDQPSYCASRHDVVQGTRGGRQ